MSVVNLLPTIAPKSDQLNADDLIGRSMTIRVTKVSLSGDADQPIAVHFEGDQGKPYKPCKSMRRVMVHIWGPDGPAYAGRRMTLYRDDRVQFGGQAVGGIRISHMSHIDSDVTMALTAARANRKPFTVRPLAPEKDEVVQELDLLTILAEGREAAARGSAPLTAWWSRLSKAAKLAAKPTLDAELKATAARADQAAMDADAAVLDGDDIPQFTETPPSDDGQEPRHVVEGEREGAGQEPASVDSPPAQPLSDFDALTWASEVNSRLETDEFSTLAAVDAFTSDPGNLERFQALEEESPGIARTLNAAITGRRKALADKERG